MIVLVAELASRSGGSSGRAKSGRVPQPLGPRTAEHVTMGKCGDDSISRAGRVPGHRLRRREPAALLRDCQLARLRRGKRPPPPGRGLAARAPPRRQLAGLPVLSRAQCGPRQPRARCDWASLAPAGRPRRFEGRRRRCRESWARRRPLPSLSAPRRFRPGARLAGCPIARRRRSRRGPRGRWRGTGCIPPR